MGVDWLACLRITIEKNACSRLIGKQAIDPGGPGEIRTLDLLSAIEARSQLRYRPN